MYILSFFKKRDTIQGGTLFKEIRYFRKDINYNFQILFSRSVDDTVTSMVDSKNIIIVPGYGLAVAKGQYPVAELVGPNHCHFKNKTYLNQRQLQKTNDFHIFRNSIGLLASTLELYFSSLAADLRIFAVLEYHKCVKGQIKSE